MSSESNNFSDFSNHIIQSMAKSLGLPPKILSEDSRMSCSFSLAGNWLQQMRKAATDFANTMAPLMDAIANAAWILAEQRRLIDEQNWWKNHGKPPEYRHKPNAPEWWQRDDEPPLTDLAV